MGRLLSLAVLVGSVLLKPSSLFTQPLLLFEFGLVLDFLGYIFLSILFGWIILTEFGKTVMGGNGKGKSGAGSAKGAGKGGAAPPAGVGQLAVTDEAWAAMSGKQRKLFTAHPKHGPAHQWTKVPGTRAAATKEL